MSETPENESKSREVYRDDYLLIRDHIEDDPSDTRVAVQVGRNPDDTRATIVDARDVAASLSGYLDK